MNKQTALHPLGGGIKIYTNSVHKFGTDAILLADFTAPRASDIACDLGTGCGIIPMLFCKRGTPKSITAIDIQADAIELLEQSVALNGLNSRITPVNADLRALDPDLSGKFTLVTMNPPYKKLTGGMISPDDGRAIARHEIKCTLDDITRAAARLLKPSGRLCMCHRPERLADLICAMRSAGIEPKRLRLVCARVDSAPSLVLCEGRKGGKSAMTVEPPLIIEDAAGEYSAVMREIYADFLTSAEEDI